MYLGSDDIAVYLLYYKYEYDKQQRLDGIYDEYDEVEEEYKKIDDTTFMLDGCMTIYEVSKVLDVTIPEGDYDTLMEIVKNCQYVAAKAGCKSMNTYVKISYKPEGDVLTIEKKVTKHHK